MYSGDFVIILINKPHFLFFGKTWFNFSCKQRSWTLNISKLKWCFVAWLILFVLFAYSVIQNSLIWPGFFFSFKTYWTLWLLKDILCYSTRCCPRITLLKSRFKLFFQKWPTKIYWIVPTARGFGGTL